MVVELSLIATLFEHITNLINLVMFKSSVGLEYIFDFQFKQQH
jgi:hypothetical protein